MRQGRVNTFIITCQATQAKGGIMQETQVWEIEEKVKVKIGEETLEYDSVTAEDIKAIAREHGIKKFVVFVEGQMVNPSAFPLERGEVEIKEYNEAK